MSNGNYDLKTSCNYCGGENNEVTDIIDNINEHISECKTTCKDCGKHDYWDTGHFMSSSQIEGKCKKY